MSSTEEIPQLYHPQINSKVSKFTIKVLLVDDQVIIAEAVKKMLEDQQDISFYYCSDPSKAILMANQIHPTLILQDLVMPNVDGLLLARYFRANPKTKDIPLIVLSSKEDPAVKAEAFALGANDYMVKLPDKIEVIARIRYHSNAYIRLLERNEAFSRLEESQQILNAELNEAAAYVKSLLPQPMNNSIRTTWRFIPSTHLGGDAFGYHWIDDTHFAMYLLDVCGHGVGAALLSITAINVLRSHSLPDTNFLDPISVLTGLNKAFKMENHNFMFFTIWYGVYNRKKREILYSTGGHPPAILLTGKTKETMEIHELKTEGLVIGGVADAKFVSAIAHVEEFNKLYIFSDGVYELEMANGTVLQISDFIDILKAPSENGIYDVDRILQACLQINKSSAFADDYSIVEVIFGSEEGKPKVSKKKQVKKIS